MQVVLSLFRYIQFQKYPRSDFNRGIMSASLIVGGICKTICVTVLRKPKLHLTKLSLNNCQYEVQLRSFYICIDIDSCTY